ncbi:aminotransferase class I/II-fold pyridoxal phosphate-dependent enzyme [Streptomyces sp. NPDC088387]|uniref:aminotransferase class I/II-fold pyridoxal phosphate-dependent enzyme n=1 Tax=Streptomyces sp. NPDC088387 TaxID=3365859 RepID=UPI0037FB048B
MAGVPAIAEAHFRAEAYPWEPRSRPDGFLNLGTAENRLLGDLHAAYRPPPLTDAGTRYAPLYGTALLRERIARHLGGGVCPEDLVVVAGATAALDVIATALCDPGDGIVVPTPYYGAFDTDLAGRSGARLLPAPPDPADGHGLSPAAVRRVLDAARRDGTPVRAVALASPGNPTGTVYPPATLRELARTAAAYDVDLIADEIYAGSVFGPGHFVGLREFAGPRVHTVWGFAKDFALPGLKAGVLHTPDPAVRDAARALAYFAPLSTHTQAVLADLLADPGTVAAFLAENRRRLRASYQAATALLDAHGIPYVPAQAGCSVWADLGAWLPGPDPGFDAERELWRAILDRTRVSILPGEAFHAPRPGWFRVCHTLDAAMVGEALTRLGRFLGTRQKEGLRGAGLHTAGSARPLV